jgi:hypothetical protein
MTKPKRRYWTQFGYTKEQAAVNYEKFTTTDKMSPWTSQTKYYMEHIIEANISTIFQINESIFLMEPQMVCTLLTCNRYNFKYDFAKAHYLGFYFDHELK